MSNLSLNGFGYNAGAAPTTPVVVPTYTYVPITVGGNITAGGWAGSTNQLLQFYSAGRASAQGTSSSSITLTVATSWNYILTNFQPYLTGDIAYELVMTLSGTLSSVDVIPFIGVTTVAKNATTRVFTLTNDAMQSGSTVVGGMAKIQGTISYTPTADDILIFGLRNNSGSAINNGAVTISGTLLFKSTLA